MATKSIKYVKGKGWFVDNAPVKDGYIAFDKNANVKSRYNKDGTVTRLVNGKDFEDNYKRKQREKEIEKKYINQYNENAYRSQIKNKIKLTLANIISPITGKYLREVLNDEFKHDLDLNRKITLNKIKELGELNETHPIDNYEQELSDAWEKTLKKAKIQPNIAKLYQWSLKHQTPIYNEKYYTTRDINNPNNYTIYNNGIPIHTNKQAIKDIIKAGLDEGLTKEEALSIAYGETDFGTNLGWVENYNNNYNKPNNPIRIPQSLLIHNHNYSSGVDYPVNQELFYLNNEQGAKVGGFPVMHDWDDAYKQDISNARTKKLIEESDSIFKNRAPDALHHMFRQYKNNPNSINSKHSTVDKYGRTYKQKVIDNAKKLRPYLEAIQGLKPVNIR